MNDITSNPYLNGLAQTGSDTSANQSEPTDSGELGQSAFLELMIAQMENQNPLEPQENSEFVAQLAQFSSVEGLDKLNNSFDSFASNFMSNQALQASSLVGTSVSVKGTTSILEEGDYVGGAMTLPESTGDLSLGVYSDQGELLENIPLGAQPSGDLVFRWDGSRIEINGKLLDWQSDKPISAGNFSFQATSLQDNESVNIDMSLTANVNSVTVDSNNQLILNLAGIGPVNINDVKQFNE